MEYNLPKPNVTNTHMLNRNAHRYGLVLLPYIGHRGGSRGGPVYHTPREKKILALKSYLPLLGALGCQGGIVTLVRRTVVSCLGHFPTIDPPSGTNCHLWLQVVVRMRPRPHPGQRFRRTGQIRRGYSHMYFKPMVKRGLSTLACEDWNRRRARKKPAVAISTGSKAETESHCGEQSAR